MLKIIQFFTSIKSRVDAARKDQIQNIVMRHRRYETIDGAFEIGCGTGCLCLALSSYISGVLPDSLWRNVIGWSLLICVLPVSFCIYSAIKKNITWPRTGYVVYRGKSSWMGRVAGLAVACCVAIGLSYLMLSATRHHGAISPDTISPYTIGHVPKSLLAILGAIIGPLYVISAAGSGKHLWKRLLLFPMVMGPLAIVHLVPGSSSELTPLVMSFISLLWLISGGGTLCLYIRHNKLPVPEAE